MRAIMRFGAAIVAPMVGGQQLLIILVIVLLLFGSSKLPELARSLGSAQKEFKKGLRESEEEEEREGKPDSNG